VRLSGDRRQQLKIAISGLGKAKKKGKTRFVDEIDGMDASLPFKGFASRTFPLTAEKTGK